MRVHTLILVAAMALLSPLARAASAQNMDRDSWSGPIGGASIVIDNPYGDIRLRNGGSEDNLEVAAVFQQLATDGSKLVLEMEITDDVASVKIVKYDAAGNPSPEIPRRYKARADLALLVPEGSPVTAATTSGLIEVQGVHTDVDLTTATGTIRAVKTHGRIDAHADGGAIEITLEPSATKRPQHLSSVTGPITVFTSATNDLAVTMATSGAFITDFSLTVENHDHEEPNKTATATIGRGGPVLEMSSKRGDLALRRVVTAGDS
jgi:hypothetical protein